MAAKSKSIIKNIPGSVDSNEVLNFLDDQKVTSNYIKEFKSYTNLTDDQISMMLDLNVKTYRSYKSVNKTLSERLQEHMIALFSLFKHGIEFFGSHQEFKNWLIKENFFFDGESPEKNLKTYSGIKFIDDRLTAMEYGDNV